MFGYCEGIRQGELGMLKFFVIGLGGALGALLRYVIGGLDYRFSNGVFPISTLVVNISGSLLIGFFWGIFERFVIMPEIRLFIFIGILGGYTTFSTFSLETFNLINDGEYQIAIVNILLSVILSIAAVFTGNILEKILISLFK